MYDKNFTYISILRKTALNNDVVQTIKAYLSSFLVDKFPFIPSNCVKEPTLILWVLGRNVALLNLENANFLPHKKYLNNL